MSDEFRWAIDYEAAFTFVISLLFERDEGNGHFKDGELFAAE